MSSNFVYFYANDESFFILKQELVCILSSCYSRRVYLEAKKLSMQLMKPSFHKSDDNYVKVPVIY